MHENLDAIISFVVVIAGISVLLQIITEMVKNGLKLRWAAYESFFLDIYRNEFFTEQRSGWVKTKFKASKFGAGIKNILGLMVGREPVAKRPKIMSVQLRLDDLKTKLVSVGENLQVLRATLAGAKDLAQNPEEFARNIPSLKEELQKLSDAMKHTKLNDIFSIYLEVFNRIKEKNKSLEAVSEQGKAPILSGDLIKGLQDALDGVSTWSDKPPGYVQEAVGAILSRVDEVEKFVTYYKTKITDQIDSRLNSLEQFYTRSIASWTFCIGLFLVAVLNLDSRLIYRTLKSDPAVRATIMEQSKSLSESRKTPSRGDQIGQLSNDAANVKKALRGDPKVDLTKSLDAFVSGFTALSAAIRDDAESFNKSDINRRGAETDVVTLPFDVVSTNQLKESLDKFQAAPIKRPLSRE